MLLWGSLFPMIKIGYRALAIDTGRIPDILMFAALRFTVCGIILCAVSLIRRETIAAPKFAAIRSIIIMGLFQIVLHYACTYIGLTVTDSSKTALIKQTGSLLYVCTAFLFIKEESFSVWKLVGGIVGFLGIVSLNAGNLSAIAAGDLLILGASVCTVVSGIMSHRLVKGTSPFWVTGISQLSGGCILLAAAILLGGSFPTLTVSGLLVFAYICAASIGGYVLYAYAQRLTSLSRLFVIKFAEPLFACLFGAILLGENIFRLQYLAAFLLISAGILLGSRKNKG